MKLSNVEKKEKNQVVLTIEVEPQVFEDACEKSYRKNVHSINIQGFRKGHAPRKIVEKLYGPEIFYEDAMNLCIPEAYEAALKEAALDVVSQPAIMNADVKEDGTFVFEASVFVKPEVTVAEYKGLEAEKEDDSVSAEEVTAELERMQQRNARLVPVEREAQKGDTVNLDFEGSVDGVPFEGGKGEKFDLQLGSGMFIPGFEEQLEGKKAGETCDVNVTFPEDYQEKSLAGKPAVFKCTINEVKESQKPELDDEFAKDVSEFDTLDEMKADLEKTMKESKAQRVKNALQEKLMDKVIEKMDGEIPQAMVESQLDRIEDDFGYRLAMQGMSLDNYLKMQGMDHASFRKIFNDQALRQVKIRLALEKIAAQEKLEATAEELEAEFKKLADNNKMDVDKIKELLSEAELKADLACQKASDLIMNSAVLKKAKKPRKTTKKADKAEKTEEAAPAEDKAEDKAE
ncbi:MAG: trigger factor [Clostridia bacterium]|nr:trigger factor [Clostridia bacterium]MDY2929099.1 trigger factor [Clostridiaceae bacterium]